MDNYPVGTKEYLIVDVSDRLHNLTDLASYAVTYSIIAPDGTFKYTDATAVKSAMQVKCLFDSTGWDGGKYALYIKITLSPEIPVLGPFYFGVDEV